MRRIFALALCLCLAVAGAADARFIANQLNGFGVKQAATGGPLAITYLGTTASSGSYGATITGNINFGTAVAGAKYIVLVGGWRGNNLQTYTAPTVDGNAFTQITGANVATADFRSQAFFFDDASGALSGIISTTISSGANTASSGAVWYKVENAATGQPNDQQSTDPATNNVNHTIDVAEGGGVIAYRADSNDNGDTWSWSGDMVNGDEDVEASSFDTDYASASKDGLSADATFNVNANTSADFDHQGISLSFSPL